MNAYALFHMNINYSSIDAGRHSEILDNCYWPFLNFAETQSGTVTLEASGNSLEKLKNLDSSWIEYAARLIQQGKMELITGGYHQIIGPLAPPEINLLNLVRGLEVVEDFFGVRPTTVLPSEQAFARSLIPIYAAAGFERVILDFDNFKTSFREAPAGCVASFSDYSLKILWCSSIAYQRFQRTVHGEIGREEFTERTTFDSNQIWTKSPYPMYSGDLEIFGVRPGRYRAERPVSPGEWRGVEEVLHSAVQLTESKLVGADTIITDSDAAGESEWELENLTDAIKPTLVKKQPKYNLSRWALGGRDDLMLNATAMRMAESSADLGALEDRQVLEFFASDYRTHITDARWAKLERQIESRQTPKVNRPRIPADRPSPEMNSEVSISDGNVLLSNPVGSMTLDTRRGLSISHIHRSTDEHPLGSVGKISHGSVSRIDLTPDWFSGNLVIQEAGESQVTDLGASVPEVQEASEGPIIRAEFETKMGQIRKSLAFSSQALAVTVSYVFPPYEMRGSLRFGFLSALVPLNQIKNCWYETHLGGYDPERFAFPSEDFDLGAPLSLNQSCHTVIPIVEGLLRLNISETVFRYEFDRNAHPFCGLLSLQKSAEGFLVRFNLTARELDDTSIPHPLPREEISYTLTVET
jgi:hypothetical protein